MTRRCSTRAFPDRGRKLCLLVGALSLCVAAETRAQPANDPAHDSIVRVVDYGPIDGTHDTAAIRAAYARAEALLASDKAAVVVFPPGRLVVTGSPVLTMPPGADLVLNGQATELFVPDAGNGLTVAVAPAGTAGVVTQVAIRGFRFTKGSVPGGSGVAIMGGPMSQPTRPAVSEVICTNNAGITVGWANCILAKDTVLGTFDDVHAFFGNGFGSPADGTLLRLTAGNEAGIQPGDARDRAAVDNRLSNVSLSGGFAGIWADRHTEGIYASNFRVVGAAYGVYWPHRDAQDQGLYLSLSNGHLNAQIRGVYADGVFDVMLTNILFFNPRGDQHAPADALLPVDRTAWATTPDNWAAIDIQNAANFIINGNTIYGAHVGSHSFAGIVIDTGHDYAGGQDRPNAIVGNTITGASAPPIFIADGAQNTVVSANSIIAAPPMRLPATVASAGNVVDGRFNIGDNGSRANMVATTNLDVSGGARIVGGAVILPGLPETDPHVKDQLWRDRSGLLRVSNGPATSR